MRQIENKSNANFTLQNIIMGRFVQLRLQFSDLRIRHPLIIFLIIWLRFLFGTFFNIAVVSSQTAFIFETIQGLWKAVTQLSDRNQVQLANLLALIVIAAFSGFSIITFASDNKNRRTAFIVNLIVFTINPILIRYVICLIAKPKYLSLSHPMFIVGVTCLICCFLLEITFFALAFTSKMKNQNLLACQKSFAILIKLQINNLLIIICTILLHLKEERNLTIIVTSAHFILAIGPVYSICRQFIFHSEYSEFVYTTVSCVDFSFSLVALICQISKDDLFKNNIQLLTCILSVFLFFGIRQFKRYRDSQIMINRQTQIRCLKIYLHIISTSLMEKQEFNQIQFILNVLRDRHRKNCQQPDCRCRVKHINQEELDSLRNFLISGALQQIIKDFSQNFQLNILCCFFMLDFLHAFPDLLTNLNRMKQSHIKNSSTEVEFIFFKTCLRIFLDHKKDQAHAIQTEKIQQQDALILFFAKTIQQILECKHEFWVNLSKKNPNSISINELVNKITSLNDKMQQKFPTIFSNFRYSRTLLEMISIYDFCVKLKASPRSQLKQALQYQFVSKNEALKIINRRNFRIEALMFQKNCVIFQSEVQKNRMGIILNVSKNITEVFGFKRQEITGGNINEIMPKSMQKQHDIILESWRERVSWDNIHKLRHIFALNKDHNCFSTSIYLRIVQRLDSVNLLATFFKGNQNDYLLINQDKVIDGVGINWKKALGFQIVKIPFSIVCDNSEFIIQDARKCFERKKVTLVCYHTRGLEDQLELYQLSKYQISKSFATESVISEQEVKTKNRCIRISAYYEPYRMGSRFFVVLKFIGIERSKSLKQIENDDERRYDRNFSEINPHEYNESQTPPEDQQQRIEEYNSSIHTSNYGLSASSESLFSNLQQKMRKNNNFTNKSISLYLGIIFFCIFSTILILIVEQMVQIYFNDNFDDHSRESARFFKKFTSLSLINSRILNIQMDSTDKQFEFDRIIVELNRVRDSVVDQHIGLWLVDQWGNPATLQKLLEISTQDKKITIVFEEYFNFYLAYCKMLYQNFVNGNENYLQQIESDLIQKNQISLKKYIDSNLQILESSILQDLGRSIIFSRSIIALFTFFAVMIGYLVQKFEKIKQEHCEEVFNVYFSISDKNCEQCTSYYRKATQSFKQCMRNNGLIANDAKKIETQIVEKNLLIGIRKKFQIQFDKFCRKKTQAIFKKGPNRLRLKIIGIGLLMLIGIVIKQVKFEEAHTNQTNFINIYFQLFNSERQLVNHFLNIKKNIQNPLFAKTKQWIQNEKQLIQKDQKEGLSYLFFSLFQTLNQFQSQFMSIQTFENQTLCAKISQTDPHFYSQMCHRQNSFPFARLKLFQAHSVILQSLQNVVSLSSVNQTLISNLGPKLKTAQQVINLQYIYLCDFVSAFEKVTHNYHQNKIAFLTGITIGVISSLLFALVFIVYFAGRVSKTMSKNCGRVLVVPEVVLKNTKGAMKHIDNVLQAVE